MGQSGASCETKPAWTAGALSFVAIMAMTACAPVPRQRAANCAADEAALMALDYPAFDQSLPAGGWRGLAERGCHAAAAALIARWRVRNGAALAANDAQTLWWHEGQMLAMAGEYRAAIVRLETSRALIDDPVPPADAPAESVEQWRAGIAVRDAWHDATIAFLRRDRAARERAYARMRAVPEPAGFREMQQLFEAKLGRRMAWPPNIEGVEDMRACFRQRYQTKCRAR